MKMTKEVVDKRRKKNHAKNTGQRYCKRGRTGFRIECNTINNS